MSLPFMHEHYQELAQTAADKHWSHIDYLAELINGEAAWREDRSVKRGLKLARFPVHKTMDQFDWNWPTKINRLQIRTCFGSTSSPTTATWCSSPEPVWARATS